MFHASSYRFVPTAICLVGALIVLPVAALAGTDMQMNPTDSTLYPTSIQNEVSLTLNPASAGNVVTAYNDFAVAGGGLGISYSTNYGAAWTETAVGLPTPTDPASGMSLPDIFDPITGADTQGRVYAGYIASNWTLQGPPSGLYVEYSDNGGANWSGPVNLVSSAQATLPAPDLNYRFNDKPHLTVDRTAGSPYTDNVYVASIQDAGYHQPFQPWSDIMFSRSTNRGVAWSAAVKISDAASGAGMCNGPNAAAAPDGSVYVAWLNVDVTNSGAKPGTLMLDRSGNGGQNFGTDMSILTVQTLANNLSTASGAQDARARGYPSIAVNPSNSNEVYMVYAADPDYVGPANDGPDEADIYLIKISSTDGWASWNATTPLQINDDGTTYDQFEPWIAVKSDGTIDVAWYDKRNSVDTDGPGPDDTDDQWDVYIAKSTDGGSTFSTNLRVSDSSFIAANPIAPNPPGPGYPWIGEYLGLATDGTDAYIGFTSTINEPQNGLSPTYGDVFFDRIPNADIPEPATLSLLAFGALLVTIRRRRRK